MEGHGLSDTYGDVDSSGEATQPEGLRTPEPCPPSRVLKGTQGTPEPCPPLSTLEGQAQACMTPAEGVSLAHKPHKPHALHPALREELHPAELVRTRALSKHRPLSAGLLDELQELSQQLLTPTAERGERRAA